MLGINNMTKFMAEYKTSESDLSSSDGGSLWEDDGERPNQLQNVSNDDDSFLCTDSYSSSDDIPVANLVATILIRWLRTSDNVLIA